MSKPSTIDSTEDIQAVLSDTPFDPSRITSVSKGWGNNVYRLHLKTPYEGKRTLVLKHFFGEFELPGVVKFTTDGRRLHETAGLRFANKLVSPGGFVQVPMVHFEDEERQFYIADDCGVDTKTLKQLMIDHALTPEQAQTIGIALATFIATMHTKGSATLGNDPAAYKLFSSHKGGRDAAAWRYYARLVEVIQGAGDAQGSGLIGLPIEVSQADLRIIASVADKMKKTVLEDHRTFTMGDFWTGNIVVDFEQHDDEIDVQGLWVVDWELAQTGITGLDIGQMMGEMYFLQHFHPKTEEAVTALRSGFFRTYSEENGMREEAIKQVAAHVGSHLVTVGSTIPWGTQEQTKRVVEIGIDYILKAYSGDRGWLESCFVGQLLQS